MTIRVFWLIRVAAFALVAALALISPARSADQRAIQIACFATVGLALLAWAAAEAFPRFPAWGLPAALAVMAVAGGVAAATTGSGQGLVAFACVAATWAGSDTGLPASLAVTAAGIVAIWIAGPIAGSSFDTMAGYPLLIVACLSLGRNRRSYRVEAEQSAALLEQHERLRAQQRRADVLRERARVADEIHDVLASSLGALSVQLQAASATLTEHQDVERAVEGLTVAQRMAADGLAETRRAIHALRARER